MPSAVIDADSRVTVDVAVAIKKGLAREHEGRQYVLCGKGCDLGFGDDPEAFRAVVFTPSM